MNFLKTGFAFLLVVSSILGCEKDNTNFSPSLPAVTQTGENTFGCYVGGVLVVPRSGKGGTLGPSAGMLLYSGSSPDSLSNYDNDLRVRDHKSGTNATFILHISSMDSIYKSSREIKESNCENPLTGFLNPTINVSCTLYDPTSNTTKQFCSIENSGILTITNYDIENKIFSGTFHCRAMNLANPEEIIEITEGRFDINWGTLTAYTSFP
jgi:hypothetical protein